MNAKTLTKPELETELDDLRIECDRMETKQEIMDIINRIVTVSDLQKIKDYAEKVYKESMKHWGMMYGVRDNIVDMADNLAELQNFEELQFFNSLMYGMLLDSEPRATENLSTVTDGMRKSFFEKRGTV